MDYEKKYEKLVDAVKVLRDNNPSDEGIQNWVNDNVPELKESEDERIRKSISNYINVTLDDNYSVEKEKWLGWLEKQGEKSIEDVAKEITKDKESAISFLKTSDIMDENGELAEEYSQCNNKPKFKVGDWIVKGNITAQILDVQEQYYVGIDTNGNDFTSSRFLSDDKIHLWTIQDAKDGDVLSNGEMIVIFKHFEEPSYRQHIVAYIGLDICGKIQITDYTWNLGIDKAKPATKEQRDLLFQKMKEAGYEWDAEKKELKKIEPNPAWSDVDETKLKCACALIRNTSLNGNGRVVDSTITWLKSLKERIKL